jgi:dTDP-4-amino-4,6-dideoxygalactose transaminase
MLKDKQGGSMDALAIHGGKPVRRGSMPAAMTTGSEEVKAVNEVITKGLLSGFVGSPSPEFFGGPVIRKLEDAWSEKFGVRHSIACNSATSGLIMAVGAIGIGPGDEVIVSPYTMSATATAILFYGGIPVFADIERDCYCLDPESVSQRVTERTKAILTVDIHGQPSNMDALLKIAKEKGLKLIVDAAQSPGARYRDAFAGTIGDIGVFSLNRHKNIQCGEGGIVVTNDDELSLRLKLIRNHAENMVDKEGFSPKSLVNMLGFNFRMTELEGAVAYEQLKKLDALNNHRIELAQYLNERLSKMPGIQAPAVRKGCTHVYYMYNMLYNEEDLGVSRENFLKAVRAEGAPVWGGYMKPLYLQPLYQKKIAIGDKGFPFVGSHYSGTVNYEKGICPIAEEYYEKRTIVNPYLYPPITINDVKDIADAFEKVIEHRKQI